MAIADIRVCNVDLFAKANRSIGGCFRRDPVLLICSGPAENYLMIMMLRYSIIVVVRRRRIKL